MQLNAHPDTQKSPPIRKWRRRPPRSYLSGTPQMVNLVASRFLHTDASLVLDLPRAREFHTRRPEVSPMARFYHRSCVVVSRTTYLTWLT